MTAASDQEQLAGSPAAAHPAPHRRRVSPWAIGVGVCAAPSIWAIQLLTDVSLSGHACGPRNTLQSQSSWLGLPVVLLTINVVAVALCLAAAFVAWGSWRATRNERPGSGHHVLESGDGRTRFLALVGLMTSVLFGAAIILESVNFFVVPSCAR